MPEEAAVFVNNNGKMVLAHLHIPQQNVGGHGFRHHHGGAQQRAQGLGVFFMLV